MHGAQCSFPRRTGLYTSPHLLQVNERIRINFEPIDKARFAKYVFEVRDCLNSKDNNRTPHFLQLLTLVSLHTFLQESVEVAIYETHHGGEFDSTNVIENPVVTAITSIGMDHINDLGPTLENIAWHKAGIFKQGVAAFSVPQEPSVSAILQRRSVEKGNTLKIVGKDLNLPRCAFDSSPQHLNCSLARAVSDEFLRLKAPDGEPRCLS